MRRSACSREIVRDERSPSGSIPSETKMSRERLSERQGPRAYRDRRRLFFGHHAAAHFSLLTEQSRHAL
jgi:hypothetical protein